MSLHLNVLQPQYERAFRDCAIRADKQAEVEAIAARMVALRSHYENVEAATGIPWWFAGILHYREWNFAQPALFEKKAAEVLIEKNYHQARSRTLGAYLWGFDLWNGFRDGSGDKSQWVWGGTNVVEADQVGVAPILVHLQSKGIVDMPKPEEGKRLVVLADTLFKARPEQSFRLSGDDKLGVKIGTQFDVLEDDPAEGNHMKVTLPDGVLLGQNDRSDWYVFRGHVSIEGTEPDNQPQDEPEEPEVSIQSENKGSPITIPKLGTVYLGNAILDGGHFSWAEATKNGARIPVDETVVDGILKIAEVMEEVREYLGDRSIRVNSWYRDPTSNRRAGGARKSRHLSGDAVDFVVSGIAPPQVNRKLESWWGSQGGLASSSRFTHIDARGYRARWSYGF
ncbi:MAG: D-Ala-D-Ala carboxypeptidase family metallohydrolase [Cyanobacteria bacterium P01_A01_bin.135]